MKIINYMTDTIIKFYITVLLYKSRSIMSNNTRPHVFENTRPNGQEVVDWLGEQGLISYIM